MSNYKTTLAGILGAVILCVQQWLSSGNLDTHTLLVAAAIAVLGVLAKDFNVTGGTTQAK